MIEIFVLVLLCSKVGSMARARGRSAWPYQLLTVLCWFAGEAIGLTVGIYSGSVQGWPIYLLFALGGAAVSTLAWMLIMDRLSFLSSGAEQALRATKSEADEAWEEKMLLRKALKLEKDGQWDQAIDHFEQLIVKTPNAQNIELAREHIQRIRELKEKDCTNA
jgi:tetratricopeptide (TPR) repeat protein